MPTIFLVRPSTGIHSVHRVLIPYGSAYGSKMWSQNGSACSADFLPFWSCHHIQDHFEFRFPEFVLTRFERGFSLPIFEPPAGAARYFSSARNLTPRLQYGSTVWVRPIRHPDRNPHPTPRCRDCSIVFRICKSFLQERNHRQTAP